MKKSLLLLLFLCSVCSAQFAPEQKPTLGYQINYRHPLSDGLVGCWLMNEGGGNKVYDLSGNGNTGTFTGTAPAWASGKYGPVVSLPGTDEYIALGAGPSLVTPNAMTIVLGVNIGAFDNDPLISKALDAGSRDWNFAITVGREIKTTIFAGFDHTSVGADLIVNTPYQVVWTYDEINSNIYRNGINVGTAAQTSAIPDRTNTVNIGTVYQINYTNIKVSYAYIYNRALTASEISQLYSEPFCMFKEDLPVTYMYQYAAAAVTFQAHVRHGLQEPALGTPINWSLPINNGLVINYPLNEGQGGMVSDAVSGDTMDFLATGTSWTTIAGPTMGHGIIIDGTTGIQNTNVSASLPHAIGSFSIWVSDTYSAGVGNEGTYICLHDNSNQNRVVFLTGSDEALKINIQSAGVTASVWTEAAHPLTAGQIYHLVATWDTVNDNYNLYRDGVLITPTSTDVSDAPVGMVGVTLGALHDPTFWPLAGTIVQASVYNRILAADEALYLYEQGYGNFDYDVWFTTEEAAAAAAAGQIIWILMN